MTDDRMTAHDVIAEVMRTHGWTCEYHEPVSGPGECGQCDNSHGLTSTGILMALKAAGWELGLSQEMGHMTAPCGGWVGGWTPEETP